MEALLWWYTFVSQLWWWQFHKTTHVINAKKKNKNKMKRQPNELEKVCANNITNKGLILKIYKELIQLNIKNNKQPNLKKKIDRGPGKFFKEDIDCQKTHERMCHITNYQGNEISKSTMRYHLTPVRMVWSKTQVTRVNEDVEKREPSEIAVVNVTWYTHHRKQKGGSLKN